MELHNFDILTFLTTAQPIDYEIYTKILVNLRPNNMLLGKSMVTLTEQPFKSIITIEDMFSKLKSNRTAHIDITAVAFQIPTEEIEPVGIFDFFGAFNFIFNSFTQLKEREKMVLSYEPDADELEAGIENLSKFGRLATIDTIAGGDLLKHEQVIQLPYSRIFTKMYLESEKAKIRKALQIIKNRPE